MRLFDKHYQDLGYMASVLNKIMLLFWYKLSHLPYTTNYLVATNCLVTFTFSISKWKSLLRRGPFSKLFTKISKFILQIYPTVSPDNALLFLHVIGGKNYWAIFYRKKKYNRLFNPAFCSLQLIYTFIWRIY